MEQENKQENRFEETMIEGRNAVLEAFRSGKTVDKLLRAFRQLRAARATHFQQHQPHHGLRHLPHRCAARLP